MNLQESFRDDERYEEFMTRNHMDVAPAHLQHQ